MNLHLLCSNIGRAFRKIVLPGVILQAIAAGLAVAYYCRPEVRPAFALIAGLKAHYGILFAIVSTAVSGGLIPYCYLRATGLIRRNHRKQFWFYLLFWAVKGAEVDLFYRLQGHIFGTGNDWQTVVVKTTVDQLLYAPLWMVPTICLAYLWKDSGFSYTKWLSGIDTTFLQLTLPTVVISNWLVWVPAVTMIYLMPADLQVPFYNLVQCFFVLLLTILSRETSN